ncbi:xanthine dehydrogenase YagR molybdenum-binding subunit [Sphingomonas sp. SORGH_AS802]|uniref:xanthine dehydrogenase family protein molybdopterin-binding subunit n=1 Tax=unclassified Sphingomonas TaxID=196159 RepID=UPI002861FE93|nr:MULTISPECIES: xanthine dehydrogenase family protein molybdopterin-binding subunit [unclassified Sphingomonas]MDR6126543.1 xanthine dehydrogenase YagR molybdenum-binding subunit [Sphingomonas sp. SORGH_AS_0438]MDR6136371.1 xanthine dehydrogenase YagR molybdenum-binding subunit [Sphingomonas sp. SORGH_AS_0802]
MSIVDTAKQAAQGLVQGALEKLVPLAPDSWIPGGKPDPLIARKHGLIGQPVSRLDGSLKVTGAAAFAAEHRFDNMVYAALAYATIPRGRIAAIDTGAAEAAPGVVLVMTHRNAPRMAPPPVFGSSPTAVGPADLPILQDDRIHWNGQPVACVLAETQEQADHAAALLAITYEAEPSTTDLAGAKANGIEPGLFMGQPLLNEIGDAEAALAAAPHRVDHIYRTPRHNHNPIEPHAATLAWIGDDLVIHDASQMVTQQAQTMADVFGLRTDQVRLTSPYVGGGFGSKGLWDHQVIAAAAARLAHRPVRIALSREGVYRIVGGRTLTEQRVAIGATDDGKFEALIHTGLTVMTPHNAMPEPFILGTRAAYAAPNMLLKVEVARMNMLANTFMRAPGEAVGTFALESAIDELASDLGMDPVELRIRNEPDADPTSGLPFSSRHIVEAWRRGAERFGWDARPATPGSQQDGEWRIGMGCATGTYPYYRMPGAEARITMTRDGDDVRAKVEVAAAEMGMGTATTTAIVAAERLGLPMERIEIGYGDSAIPGAIMAGGSQQTAAIGAAVIAAQAELVTALLKLAGNDSPLAGLSADEVGSDAGALASLAEPSRRESYASILARARRDSVTVTKAGSMPLELMHWSMHSHSALFCEVRVNTVTGETRISRFLGAFDCGRILNPKTAASQFRGGIIMGLGMALMEETLFDERNGRIMNPSLSEYHLPVHLDVPEIDVIWTDIADPHTPMGAHGVGEIGITGVAAAVANAVYNATGIRVRNLPITLDNLMR